MAYNVFNTIDAFHCAGTLKVAIERLKMPKIFNPDQNSQFTGNKFIDELQKKGIQITMDGRGRCRDNAKMEPFFWGNQRLYQFAATGFGVQHYVNFYNTQRIHSPLQNKTPNEVYFGTCNSANRGYIKMKQFTLIF